MSPGDDETTSYYAEVKRRGREANPFFRFMGIDVSQIRGGEAVLEMPVRPDMQNGEGWLQGGIFVSLADEAMVLALYTTLDEGQRIATISESTNFLKGVRDGTLVAVGRVVKRGRRVAFTEGAVYLESADGELLTRTTAAFAVLERDLRAQQ